MILFNKPLVHIPKKYTLFRLINYDLGPIERRGGRVPGYTFCNISTAANSLI